jgi:hypothetical protein
VIDPEGKSGSSRSLADQNARRPAIIRKSKKQRKFLLESLQREKRLPTKRGPKEIALSLSSTKMDL